MTEIRPEVADLGLKGALAVGVPEILRGLPVVVECTPSIRHLLPVLSQPEPCPTCKGRGFTTDIIGRRAAKCRECGGSGYPATITLTTQAPPCPPRHFGGKDNVRFDWCQESHRTMPRLSAHLEAVAKIMHRYEDSSLGVEVVIDGSGMWLSDFEADTETDISHLNALCEWKPGGWAVLLSDLKALP